MKISVLASGSSGNCYLVDGGKTKILIECGIPIRRIRDRLRTLGIKLTDIAACLISHSHGDHSKAAKDLCKAGVSVIAKEQTLEALGLSGENRCFSLKSIFPKLVVDLSRIELQFLGRVSLIAFDVEHDVDCQAFSLDFKPGNVMYVSDTAGFESLNEQKNINYLMIECNYHLDIIEENVEKGLLHTSVADRVINNHMSAETVIEYLSGMGKARLQRVYLIHTSGMNLDKGRALLDARRATGVPVEIY